MNFILQKKQLKKKRRYIDQVLKCNTILPFEKYTIIEQKYDYIYIILHFCFQDNLYNYKISQHYLNNDVDKIIKDFIHDKIKIDLYLKIKYHENHPFECPSFIIVDVKNNFNFYLNNKFKIYFNFVIYEINNKLMNNWSPIFPMNVILMYIYNLINIKTYIS